MFMSTRRTWNALSLLVIAATAVLLGAPYARAQITVGQLDDFQDGTTQDWGISFGGAVPVDNAADEGPTGVGDHSLYMDTAMHGGGRLLVANSEQWTGDWTAAGVAKVALDVRNPNSFPLAMRLGIAGPDGFSFGGIGDTHLTSDIAVPPDNQWHSIEFGVLVSDFTATGSADTARALTGVTELRIIHNPLFDFRGEDVFLAHGTNGAFYLDNIHPMSAATALAGDYNGNGTVDAADYVLWRKMNGQSGTGLAADGTGPGGEPDGIVDELDYNFWRERFGNMQPGGGHGHAAGLVPATVPEPASLELCGATLFVLAAAGRRPARGKELAN